MSETFTKGDPRKLLDFAIEAARLLSDRHCEDVRLLDVRGLSQVCDYVLIGSGTSDQQMKSISHKLEDLGAEHDNRCFRSNQDSALSWIVVDFVDVVAHLFEPGQRAYYDLEGLWSDAPQVAWARSINRDCLNRPMLREALFAKIHHAVVTECNHEYSGSITIDQDLLDATGLLVNEKVLIADCENGNRFETYVFAGPRGGGGIGVNGAAANLTRVGHRILVMSFCQLTTEEMSTHRPKVIVCDQANQIAEQFEYEPAKSDNARIAAG